MSKQELQELSRRAAQLISHDALPKGCFLLTGAWPNEYEKDGRISECIYLHESTEACAEIMVRVLWLKGITLHTYLGGVWATMPELKRFEDLNPDPTQAFRTAVLRAVVAL